MLCVEKLFFDEEVEVQKPSVSGMAGVGSDPDAFLKKKIYLLKE